MAYASLTGPGGSILPSGDTGRRTWNASRSNDPARARLDRIGASWRRTASTARSNTGSDQATSISTDPQKRRRIRSASGANARESVGAGARNGGRADGRSTADRIEGSTVGSSSDKDPRNGWVSNGRATIDMPQAWWGDINEGLPDRQRSTQRTRTTRRTDPLGRRRSGGRAAGAGLRSGGGRRTRRRGPCG